MRTTYGAPPSWLRWTVACGLAETVGMVAAASAFALSLAWLGEPTTVPVAVLSVLIAMAGGAVEGAAVGAVQWALLRPWLTRLTASAWIGVTVAAAVGGWLLGMLPSVTLALATADDPSAGETTGPPLWVMPLVGVGSGLVLGGLFGLAQAAVLRRHVRHPGRWVWANAVGWAGAMAVMFTGAGIPSEPWPWAQLLPLAAATGVLAGLVIGGATGAFLPHLHARGQVSG